MPLPAALPPDSIISTALVKLNSYALKGPFLPELEKQLEDLIAWMGNPIQLDRQGALARGVGSETLKRLDKGWHLVRLGYTKGDPAPTVFSSSYLQSYSCSTLSQWWTQFKSVHSPKSLKIGSITECRSSFIEAFTDKFRDDESKWVRAAAIMGNSIEAWKKHYAVTLKRRRCQEGIDAFASEFLLVDVVREEREERALVSMELPPCRVLSSLYQSLAAPLLNNPGLVIPMAVSIVRLDELGEW